MQKKINFSSCVTNHPCYEKARGVIKCCGDEEFFIWFKERLSTDFSCYEGSGNILNILNKLNNKKNYVTSEYLLRCKDYLANNDLNDLFSVLLKMLIFIEKLQIIENQIIAIEEELTQQKDKSFIQLTRDGNEPVLLPRHVNMDIYK